MHYRILNGNRSALRRATGQKQGFAKHATGFGYSDNFFDSAGGGDKLLD
jgi:hypothetical protein